jgi:hypothetical protein
LRGCEQPSKTPQVGSNQSEFGFAPELGSHYQNQDHFLDAKRTAIRVRKVFCHRAGFASGNRESDERDIRDKN